MELPFFEAQLRYFSKYYTAISLKEYWEIINGIIQPVKDAVVLTFDDGYLDNWQYAFPLLKKYGLKSTIFVSPEFVDKRKIVRPNIDDIAKGQANEKELEKWGFLSWEEMRIMEKTGIIDIQSHTMSHTKFFVSDKLLDFHHPGADSVYYIGNLFPERKPYYISDPKFEQHLPYGYPIFESKSSVISRKVEINPDFIEYCVKMLRKFDFNEYSFADAYQKIKQEHETRQQNNSVILSVEDDESNRRRLSYELVESKKVIEKNLNKKVEFLCWPHGDSNDLAHKMAIESGYLATTLGKCKHVPNKNDRFERIGSPKIRNHSTLSVLKLHFKVRIFQKQQPWYGLSQIHKRFFNIV